MQDLEASVAADPPPKLSPHCATSQKRLFWFICSEPFWRHGGLHGRGPTPTADVKGHFDKFYGAKIIIEDHPGASAKS